MTENYGLPGFVLHSQFILNELACYTCPPTTRGPVHCNTNSVTQFLSVNNGRYRSHLVSLCVLGRTLCCSRIIIHLLFYRVVFLNNQQRHPEVISLLTTTILSLSLNSWVVIKQTSTISYATPSESRTHCSYIRRQE